MLASIKATFASDGGKTKTVKVSRDITILEAARAAGIEIHATCGQRGRCRSCRVKILKGDAPPPTVQDSVQLGHDEVQEGFRLACQTRMVDDSTVMVVPPKTEAGHQILESSDALLQERGMRVESGIDKHLVHAKLPVEEHHQTSDVEEIVRVVPGLSSHAVPVHVMRKAPRILRERGGELTVTTFGGQIIDVEAGDVTEQLYGIAIDIGTTSVVATLLDLRNGEQLASAGGVNEQAQYGGDLMSRIAYAQFNARRLATLRAKVLNQVNSYVRRLCEDAEVSPENVYKIVVVGNTCMHHIFLGIDVSHVGLAPYAPVVRENLVIPAVELPLKAAPNAQVCLLPIIAGFVGADTVGCILATRIHESEDIRALVDIGTNGEVVMGSASGLTACSAPAGPALEGAQIRDGMRGAIGAIEKVQMDEDVECAVIGDAPAVGICGSGLIDAAASLIDARVMDSNGNLRKHDLESVPDRLRKRLVKSSDGSREFVLVWNDAAGKSDNIGITQGDIRQLQLAKSAIYSGIRMLQSVMGIEDEQIAQVMLCGGFGNYVSIDSAKTIRLLPNLSHERISYIGNAALLGAQMALLSEEQRESAYRIAQQIEHVALAARPDFQDIFVDSMNFSGSPFPSVARSTAKQRRDLRKQQNV